jgi:hypothetical protein
LVFSTLFPENKNGWLFTLFPENKNDCLFNFNKLSKSIHEFLLSLVVRKKINGLVSGKELL